MSVSKQRKILIERASENVRKDYLKVSNDNLKAAMYNLKPNAFKLWIYLLDNRNGYKMDLYPCDFTRVTGMARTTYDRAFKELEEKGYLIKSPKQKNLYLFKEVSNLATEPADDVIESFDTEDFESIVSEFFE